MATGDVKNNLRKLIVELKHINYRITELDLKGFAQGCPTSFFPILHYIFLDFSVDLTEFFAKDYELYGKTDLRFVETVYKILRDVFQYKPPLTRDQFLAIGFAERKIIQVCEILKRCREKYLELKPRGGKTEKKKPKMVGTEPDVLAKRIQPLGHLNQKDTRKQPSIEQRGKSILKLRKEEDKENGDSTLSLDVVNEKMGKMNEVEERDKTQSRLTSGIKSVRWEEKEQMPDAAVIQKSILKPSNSNGNSTATPSSTVPTTDIKTAAPLPPRVIPAPVSMTTAPEPSPDLMLTPITKAGHQAIPLSGPWHDNRPAMQNVAMFELTDSAVITQPRIIRHQYNEPGHPITAKNLPTMPPDSELKSLRNIVQELQEKLDSVLAQNNEMAARIVLLENKVKLMGEEHTKSVCDNCTNNSLERAKPHQPVSNGEYSSLRTADNIVGIHLGVAQSTSSSRRFLLDDFNSSLTRPEQHVIPPRGLSNNDTFTSQSTVIEISDDDDEVNSIRNNNTKLTPESTPSTSHQNHNTLEVISPFSKTSDIHLKFSDPSTTATIMNVERRLKETRALLASATRFNGTNVL